MGELTFYFDICFGKRFPETLSRARPPFIVQYHGDKQNKFKQDTPDDVWLQTVGAKDWVVFSHDRKFHSDDVAVAAIKHHKIGCFYMSGASSSSWEKLIAFARGYHRIADLARSTPKPYIFHLNELNRLVKVDIK